VTVLGANLFGDALRDALDPRLRTRGLGRRGLFRRASAAPSPVKENTR
jgi:hypothetical protein